MIRQVSSVPNFFSSPFLPFSWLTPKFVSPVERYTAAATHFPFYFLFFYLFSPLFPYPHSP
jgi:hypothetical protein